jgi:hypothetical protein
MGPLTPTDSEAARLPEDWTEIVVTLASDIYMNETLAKLAQDFGIHPLLRTNNSFALQKPSHLREDQLTLLREHIEMMIKTGIWSTERVG